MRSLAAYVDKRVHGDDVLQIAAAAGAADVVRLFLDGDASLVHLTKASTGNSLLHYASLGPPNVADIYKAGALLAECVCVCVVRPPRPPPPHPPSPTRTHTKGI